MILLISQVQAAQPQQIANVPTISIDAQGNIILNPPQAQPTPTPQQQNQQQPQAQADNASQVSTFLNLLYAFFLSIERSWAVPTFLCLALTHVACMVCTN